MSMYGIICFFSLFCMYSYIILRIVFVDVDMDVNRTGSLNIVQKLRVSDPR